MALAQQQRFVVSTNTLRILSLQMLPYGKPRWTKAHHRQEKPALVMSHIDSKSVPVTFYQQASGWHRVFGSQDRVNLLTSITPSELGLYLLLRQVPMNIPSKVQSSINAQVMGQMSCPNLIHSTFTCGQCCNHICIRTACLSMPKPLLRHLGHSVIFVLNGQHKTH